VVVQNTNVQIKNSDLLHRCEDINHYSELPESDLADFSLRRSIPSKASASRRRSRVDFSKCARSFDELSAAGVSEDNELLVALLDGAKETV
jgi:hypothetical protein